MLKKKFLIAIIAATLMYAILAVSFVHATLTNLLAPSLLASRLVVMNHPMPPGTFEASIYGDAYGFYGFLEMFQHFSVRGLAWSTSLPSYPPPTFVNIALSVKSLDFSKGSPWTYHLSVSALDEASMGENGSMMFSFKFSTAELDFVFSDDYSTLDITGMLRGNVDFHVDFGPDLRFDFTGRQLAINVHVGYS